MTTSFPDNWQDIAVNGISNRMAKLTGAAVVCTASLALLSGAGYWGVSAFGAAASKPAFEERRADISDLPRQISWQVCKLKRQPQCG